MVQITVEHHRTSHVCESCGGEDFNELVTMNIARHKFMVVLCRFCRSVLYKEIRNNE